MRYEHKVMNCIEFKDHMFKPGYLSPKPDGVRGFIIPGLDVVMSRSFKPLLGLDHIVEAHRDHLYASDVELVIPGMGFNELSGLIRSHDLSPSVVAWVIDTPNYNGALVDRLKARISNSSVFRRIPHHKVDSMSQFKQLHDRFLYDKFEGSVLKFADEAYTHSRKWMRLVPAKSADCPITGCYEGKGKFAGMLGGFYFTFGVFENCKVGTMKGITMTDRQRIWDSPTDYIGVTAEIQYKELQPSGMMRQPRFKGFRYDK